MAAGADVTQSLEVELTKLFEAVDKGNAGAVLVTGAPQSGKSEASFGAMKRAIERFGEPNVVMTVSNRQIADTYSDRLIRELTVTSQARPVTTLNALAFRLLADYGRASGRKPPRLLNGAEQDALLRQVLARHVEDAQVGNSCATCDLLREYFATSSWSSIVADAPESVPSAQTIQLSATTDALFAERINGEFVIQLRDMIARIDEIDATNVYEYLDRTEHAGIRGERLRTQWRLAFRLRDEYTDLVARRYPNEYRLAASALMAAAAHVVRSVEVPRVLVIDDFQDLTLAGFTLARALHESGTGLVLVGNPDESVQTFRGSYPEYLFNHAVSELGAHVVKLPYRPLATTSRHDGSATAETTGTTKTAPESAVAPTDFGDRGPSMLETLASRTSLSIASDEETIDQALPDRAWKMPVMPDTFPVRMVSAEDSRRADGTVNAALYRSEREELDDVAWQIKSRHLDPSNPRDWNDMAVIMHDNAAIRTLGERLRRDGVPVRYSSVTRPLIEEPFIDGLFSLIELAQLRNRGPRPDRDVQSLVRYVDSRMRTLAASPLVAVRGANGVERPLSLDMIVSAMQALGSLAGVLRDTRTDHHGREPMDGRPQSDDHASHGTAPMENDAVDGDAMRRPGATGTSSADRATHTTLLPRIVEAWQPLRDQLHERSQDDVQRIVTVDFTGATTQDAPLEFGPDAMLLMLAFTGNRDIVRAIAAIWGADEHAAAAPNHMSAYSSAQIDAFAHLWDLVEQTAAGLATLTSTQPQFALEVAWNACDVAMQWQETALRNTPAGREANDRLDAAMRLFEYAQGTNGSGTVEDFINHVRQLQIVADSLARTAPIDDAVTLTTPAGSAGRRWPLVWMPGIQQGVWPNLVLRNTLFGGEDLVDVQIYGSLDEERERQSHITDLKLREVLASEQKSFLVALTRACERLMPSAVLDDDLAPSDFLYTYLPEHYDRDRDADPGTRVYTTPGDGSVAATLDTDLRGLVALARSVLVTADPQSAEYQDAVCTLAVLARQGVEYADPDSWAFIHGGNNSAATADTTEQPPVATLSPSSVDAIWACPVCWLMQSQFAGPSPSNASMAFGSIMHAVAQYGTEQGFDAPDFMSNLESNDARINAIEQLLFAHYETLRLDPQAIQDPEERFRAVRRDTQAMAMTHHLAWYFVMSNTKGYLDVNAKNFAVGTLERSKAEVPFSAQFTVRDIAEAYNAIPQLSVAATTDETLELMRVTLGIAGADGWPDGMDPAMVVRLSGRIDRVEQRTDDTYGSVMRIVDFKTGSAFSGARQFNDLQLVCYQLGQAFPQHSRRHGSQAVLAMPRIAESLLFFVKDHESPGKYHVPEGDFQPALFDPAHGSLNAKDPVVRYYVKDPLKKFFYSPSELDFGAIDAPESVRKEVWQEFVGLRGTTAVWSLAMIARVFYAAAVTRSKTLLAYPQKYHVDHCRLTQICPACGGQVSTVYETKEI